jgi:hypothetical protein
MNGGDGLALDAAAGRLEAPFSIDWQEQRGAFGFIMKHDP